MKTFALIIFLAGISIPLLVEAEGNRSKLNDMLVKQFKIDNNRLLTDDYLRSNNFAIGVLRANKWNTGAASKFLKRLLAWRALNQIGQLGDSPIHVDLHEFFPYRVFTETKDGCPVLEVDGGNWRIADFRQSYEFVRDSMADFMKYTIQMFEKSRRPLNKEASQCDQAVMVLNVRGLALKHFADPNVMSTALRLAANLENHFPNLYKKIIVINSNPFVRGFVNSMLPYVGQTSKAIRLFSEGEEDVARNLISEYIDPEELIIY